MSEAPNHPHPNPLPEGEGTGPRAAVKLAVLVSGSGTTLQNLIDQITAGRLHAIIAVVIGSRAELVGIQRAITAGLPHAVVERRSFDSVAAFSQAVFQRIESSGVELVCCAGWLCLLDIPSAFTHRVINIHPSLLPSFGGKGMYGPKVHHAVIEHGCKVSGCTVHFVNAEYDSGPIILQRTCPVLDDDTPANLAARVFEQEKWAYPLAIQWFASGRLRVQGRRVFDTGGMTADDWPILDDTDPAEALAAENRAAHPPADSLDARRIERVATLHRASLRSRSWQIVLVLFCWLAPFEFGAIAWRERSTRHPVHAAVLGVMALWLLSDGVRRFRRQRRSAAAVAPPVVTEPLPPPDFAPLGDGSQRWRDLDQIH